MSSAIAASGSNALDTVTDVMVPILKSWAPIVGEAALGAVWIAAEEVPFGVVLVVVGDKVKDMFKNKRKMNTLAKNAKEELESKIDVMKKFMMDRKNWRKDKVPPPSLPPLPSPPLPCSS